MADISKCFGKGCPLKEICYRYTAPTDKFAQTYTLVDESLKPGDTHCDMFWPDNEPDWIEIKKKYLETKKRIDNANKRMDAKRKRRVVARSKNGARVTK